MIILCVKFCIGYKDIEMLECVVWEAIILYFGDDILYKKFNKNSKKQERFKNNNILNTFDINDILEDSVIKLCIYNIKNIIGENLNKEFIKMFKMWIHSVISEIEQLSCEEFYIFDYEKWRAINSGHTLVSFILIIRVLKIKEQKELINCYVEIGYDIMYETALNAGLINDLVSYNKENKYGDGGNFTIMYKRLFKEFNNEIISKIIYRNIENLSKLKHKLYLSRKYKLLSEVLDLSWKHHIIWAKHSYRYKNNKLTNFEIT